MIEVLDDWLWRFLRQFLRQCQPADLDSIFQMGPVRTIGRIGQSRMRLTLGMKVAIMNDTELDLLATQLFDAYQLQIAN